ncbi:MAG: NAD-dependent epimerase/dehydratase family protein, partial [Microthrixaceae bacterium]
MRVAITGSSGLIGSALRHSLGADGHEVVRVVRHEGGADAVRWDIDRGEIDAAALDGVDAVVHLAGEGIGDKRWSAAQKQKVLESRRQGTTLLANALAGLASPPAVLVSGSAIGYY